MSETKKSNKVVLVPEDVFVGWYQLTMKLPMEQVAGLYDALKGIKIIDLDKDEAATTMKAVTPEVVERQDA